VNYKALLLLLISCVPLGAGSSVQAAMHTVSRGQVHYQPPADEAGVPQRFRLEAHTFPYDITSLGEIADDLAISLVTFPSPVKTSQEANNTVHCEYYQPIRARKVPAVIVLHILGGDFALARVFCNTLAQNGVAALFLKMPYYGPRRDPDNPRRMISTNARETVEGMTQAILDIRQATAWLAARAEIDPQRLGVFGISLGGITAALAATAEPRLQNVCLMLSGGDIGRVGWESPAMSAVRRYWLQQGETRERFFELMQSIDPVTYATNVQGRRILMLNATEDEIIPRACTESLWEAFGQPEIVWYQGGHYSVARHILGAMQRVAQFFAREASE
jgi:dienelactone hydrolase